ncbi:MAG TPA: hypothetical protein VK662_02945 [Acidothermaceae bacterium]|nr:hypothetical protein [Acidothermaceae bacterium]
MSDETPEPALEPSEPTLAYPQPRPMPYGSSPYAVTANPTAFPTSAVAHPPLLEIADLWTAILGTVFVIPLGVVAGFVWLWLAPRAMVSADGKGNANLLDPGTKAFAGADVKFLFITVVAGLLCGAVGAILARHRGVAVSVALAAGGTIAALIAAWIGRALSGGPAARWAHHVPAGNHRFFIELTTRQYLVGWPLAALVVTFVAALATPDRPIEIEPTEPAPAEPRTQLDEA